MTVGRFRKKPVEIEAIQWDGTNDAEIRDWGAHFYPIAEEDAADDPDHTGELYVAANSVYMGVPTGEWILRDSAGFYPCKSDIFAASYDEVIA